MTLARSLVVALCASFGVAEVSAAEAVKVIPAREVAEGGLAGAAEMASALSHPATPGRERDRIEQALVQAYLDRNAAPLERAEAAELLEAHGGGTSVQALKTALADPKAGPMAARLLGRHPRPDAATALARTLEDAPEAVQGEIIAALVLRDARSGATAIANHVRSGDSAHRLAAIAALGALGGRESAYLLKQLLAAPEPSVRQEAMNALRRCAARFEAEGLAQRAEACRAAIDDHVRGLEDDEGWQHLFDGESFAGWNGNTEVFRIEEGAIVGGTLEQPLGHNAFLCTDGEWGDFELRLEAKLLGEEANGGVQIRSRRIPGHHEVIGYQADLGQVYWGALYDESRRNRILAEADPALREEIVRLEEWNDYVIRCEGNRTQLWLNGVKTVDYTEEDEDIVQRGIVCVQIHSGPAAEAWYRNIRLRPIRYTRH